MFSKAKKGKKRVGAREKLETARKINRHGMVVEAGASGPQPFPTFLVLMMFLLAVLAAFAMSSDAEGPFAKGLGFFLTGSPTIDRLIAGPGVPSIFDGGNDLDLILASFVRGLCICFVAGIIPFFTWGLMSIRDSASAGFYSMCWTASVCLLTVTYIVPYTIFPLVAGIFDLMTD